MDTIGNIFFWLAAVCIISVGGPVVLTWVVFIVAKTASYGVCVGRHRYERDYLNLHKENEEDGSQNKG